MARTIKEARSQSAVAPVVEADEEAVSPDAPTKRSSRH
jgi:DNA-binding sugar fermentation-stimulating protein